MSHFKHHVFFCTNQRATGEACCNNHGATAMRDTLPSAGPSARQAAETDEATRAARNTNAIRSDCNMM